MKKIVKGEPKIGDPVWFYSRIDKHRFKRYYGVVIGKDNNHLVIRPTDKNLDSELVKHISRVRIIAPENFI